MKRGKLLSVFLILVMGGLFFNSCEKCECQNEEKKLFDSLVGTVWSGTDLIYIGDKYLASRDSYIPAYFHEVYIKVCGNICSVDARYFYDTDITIYSSSREEYDCTYNKSEITLTPRASDSLLGILEVTINESEMSVLITKLDETIDLKKSE